MSAQDRAIQKLARELAGIKKEVVSWRGPQADYTSIENGGNFTFKDSDGNVTAVVGGQDDGGTTVNVIAGPTPPTPINYTVTVDHGSLTVHWDGEFENDAVAPTDWARWTAYAQPGEFVVPERSTAIGGTDSASGGEVTAGVLKGQWTVTVLAWSQAGKPSAMGLPVTVDVPGYGDIVLAEIDAAETVIKNAGEVLVTEQGTLGEKLDATDGTLTDLGQDLQAVEDAQAQLNTDLTDVMTSVDGKNTIKWDPAAPTSATPGKAAGDLWYRTSGNSIVGFWKWDGTDWVPQLLDVTTIPLIDIGTGTFGSMSGTRLQAGTVSTNMLAVGVGGNLLPDPKFLDPAMSAIRAGTSWTYKTVAGETCFERVMPNPGTSANLPLTDKLGNEYYLPASPGIKVSLELDVSGPVSMYLYFYMSDGSLSAPGSSIQNNLADTSRRTAQFILEPDLYATSTAVVERFSVRVRQTSSSTTAPPGTVTRVFSARVSPMSGSTVIENGAISTQKLTADVLEVKNLKATTGQLDEAVINKLFSDVVVAKTAVAEQFIGENAILTGAVTAPKITASEELWAKIAQFVKIRAEHIEADAIDGMVITGATIQSAATGARVQLSASGIESYNDANERTFYAEASSGNVYMVGSFYSNEQGQPRVEIDNDDWASIPVVDDTGATQYVNGAGVRIGSSVTDGFSIYHGAWSREGGSIRGQSAVIEGPLGRGRFSLGDNGQTQMTTLDSSGYMSGAVFTDAGGGVSLQAIKTGVVTNQVLVKDYAFRAQSYGANRSGPARSEITAYGPDYAEMKVIDSGGSPRASVRTNSDGSVNLSGSGARIILMDQGGPRVQSDTIYNTTGVTSAAVYVNSTTGSLGRNTSSARYKQEIKPAEPLDEILNVETRYWRDRQAVAQYEEARVYMEQIGEGPLPRQLAETPTEPGYEFGAIAEEVDALGLSELVIYDAFDRPDSLHYEKFGVALISPVKRHDEEIKALRDRIEQLERLTNE